MTECRYCDFIAGWFGGVSVLAICHPFDTLKVRVQGASFDTRNLVALSETPAGTQSGATKPDPARVAALKNAFEKLGGLEGKTMCPVRMGARETFNIYKHMVMNEGLRSFYRGVVAPMSGVGIATAAQFGVYGHMSSYLTKLRFGEENYSLSDHLQNINELNMIDKIVSATCGGMAYGAIISPFEVVKIRMQTQVYFDHRKYFGPLDVARKLYREGGIRKLYLGFVVTLLRDIFGSIVYFGTYGLARQKLSHVDGSHSVFNALLAGGCAGAAQWSIILPLDTIKTRQQIAKKGMYLDWIHCGRDIFRREGVNGFYYGYAPAIIRASIGNAVCFAGVETALRLMDSLGMS